MKIVNLTPHSINFVNEGGEEILEVKPSGSLARVTSRTVTVEGETYCGIPVTKTVYGEVEGLPDPEDGTIFVVSGIVAQRVPDRRDVFIPNESVRDPKGNIIGCRSLGRV